MLLRYRVSLSGIKGFFRLYDIKPSMTLYDLHKLLRDELEFPHDQQILFKAQDKAGRVLARYAMFDLGFGTVDHITVGETFSKGVESFVYFYDVTNKKSVLLSCEGEAEPKPRLSYPALVESKGPNPIEFENGYVAYEDLPDEQKHKHIPSGLNKDEDDMDDELDLEGEDEEEEEDDDEDGKVIFDEEDGI